MILMIKYYLFLKKYLITSCETCLRRASCWAKGYILGPPFAQYAICILNHLVIITRLGTPLVFSRSLQSPLFMLLNYFITGGAEVILRIPVTYRGRWLYLNDFIIQMSYWAKGDTGSPEGVALCPARSLPKTNFAAG